MEETNNVEGNEEKKEECCGPECPEGSVCSEPKEEAPAEEVPAKEPAAEAPAETPAEEPKGETCGCCCDAESSVTAEDKVRDLINLVNVYKEEEKEGVTTRVDPATAEELVAKLEDLAKAVGEVCKCE